MKRNVALSIAAGLVVIAGLAQASDILIAGAYASENVIVETRGLSGAGGGSFDDGWVKDEYPFPRHFGPID